MAGFNRNLVRSLVDAARQQAQKAPGLQQFSKADWDAAVAAGLAEARRALPAHLSRATADDALLPSVTAKVMGARVTAAREHVGAARMAAQEARRAVASARADARRLRLDAELVTKTERLEQPTAWPVLETLRRIERHLGRQQVDRRFERIARPAEALAALKDAESAGDLVTAAAAEDRLEQLLAEPATDVADIARRTGLQRELDAHRDARIPPETLAEIVDAEAELADVDRGVRQALDLQAAIDSARQVSIVQDAPAPVPSSVLGA